MKYWKFTFTVLAFLLTLSSCMMVSKKVDASDEIIDDRMECGPVSEILAASDVIIEISPVKTEREIGVRGPEEVMKCLDLRYDGQGTLLVGLNRGGLFRYQSDEQKVHLLVSSDEIHSITCSSGARIIVSDTLICATTLDIRATSGGAVSFSCIDSSVIDAMASSGGSIMMDNIAAERVDAQASSGGFIKISGKTGSIQTKGDRFLINTDNLTVTTD